MAPKSKTLEKNPSAAPRLSDTAYERILEGLFNRTVPVGGFISQNELSTIIGVPIAPLRDALRILETEGILTIHPRSGIQFVRPGMELTRATYQFRAIIERAAVRVFAEQPNETILESLELRHLRVIRSIEKDGFSVDLLTEIDALEKSLHGAVVAALNNPLIASNYRRIHNYLRLLRLEQGFTAPVVTRTLREHLEIIEACRSHDADKAEAALQAHFQAATQRTLGFG